MTHREAIDELRVLAERKKVIAQKVINSIDWRVLLLSNTEKRTAMRKILLVRFLKEIDSLFTETSKLGKQFADEKIKDFRAKP